MTLNLVIGRFFTAKLGDYTAVVLSRKLTDAIARCIMQITAHVLPRSDLGRN